MTKVCVVQDSPVFFDKNKTLKKMAQLVADNADQGAELIVFPESFIPAYPRGFNFGATIGSRTEQGKELYAKYANNSINLSTNDKLVLEQMAKDNQVYLVVGVTEKEDISGSLFCSMIYISPSKGILGVHRKIKPTGTERVIWKEAAGESLVSFQTKIGRLGGLICWENYMPLARMSMYKKGVQIYIAPTADSRDEWITTMKHIALEGRCFVLACNQYFTKSMCPTEYLPFVETEPEIMSRGGSIIISPNGKVLAGPLYNESGALFADIDLKEIQKSKLDFDVIGHYSRDDIFQFQAIDQPEIILE